MAIKTFNHYGARGKVAMGLAQDYYHGLCWPNAAPLTTQDSGRTEVDTHHAHSHDQLHDWHVEGGQRYGDKIQFLLSKLTSEDIGNLYEHF